MDMTEQKLNLVLKEIDLIEGRITIIEGTRRSIKNWCIVTWAGSLAFTINNHPSLIGLTMFIPAIFFFLDILSHRHQDAYAERIKTIRNLLTGYFRSGYISDIGLLQIRVRHGATSLFSRKPWSQFWRYAKKSRSDLFLYVALGIASVSLWLGFRGVHAMLYLALNSVGLTFDIIGVVLLFRYGLPADVNPRGARYRVAEPPDENESKRYELYRRRGLLGLGLLIAGFLLQLISNLLQL
jgi:hypothetical protein